MGKNCLNCKYEPDWGAWTKGEYQICSGKCKWDGETPILPAVMTIREDHIVRHSDDSGIQHHCKTWIEK